MCSVGMSNAMTANRVVISIIMIMGLIKLQQTNDGNEFSCMTYEQCLSFVSHGI